MDNKIKITLGQIFNILMNEQMEKIIGLTRLKGKPMALLTNGKMASVELINDRAILIYQS